MDAYRRPRSPDRAPDRYVPSSRDSFTPAGGRGRSRSPGGFRRRSRSPARAGGDSYHGRARSPARRYDDTYAPRDTRRSDFVPTYDEKRGPPRAPSPQAQLRRGPETSQSTRVSYGRARSPPRYDDRLPPSGGRRRRSPSPQPRSGRASGASSRRASPRPLDRRPGDEYASADTRSAPPGSYRPPRPRSPHRGNPEPYDARVRFPPERPYSTHSQDAMHSATRPEPMTNAYTPPAGPATYGRPPPPPPPYGSPQLPLHPYRPGPGPVPAGPSHGGSYRGRGGPPPPRDYPPRDLYAPPPPPPPPPRGRGGSISLPYGRGAPGPREFHGSRPPPPPDYRSPHPSSFDRGNATSTTYPRTQRFTNPMADLPTPRPGGEKLPPLYDTSKADKLEEEAARLRKLIDEKQAKRRPVLREWENGEREIATASLRSELAEQHLRSLNGESEGLGAGMGAAF